MYPREFKLLVPSNLDEALEAVEEGAIPLAGGQSLIPMMKLRIASPEAIVYLGVLKELSYIKAEDDQVLVGALVTHAEIERSMRVYSPLLAMAAAEIGDAQVRNVGTIGGSLAHADPAADYPAALLALGGVVKTKSKRGAREIPVDEFFIGPYQTVLNRGELIVEISVPRTKPSVGYAKYARVAGDFAIAAVATYLELDGDRIAEIRIGTSGVFTQPSRAVWVEEALRDKRLNEEILKRALDARPRLEVPSDARASADLRLKAFRAMARKAVLKAYGGGSN